MKLALECPTDLLEEIQSLADFDFCLTHLVLQDEKYAAYYSKSKRFKILDNSTNELLRPCTLDEIRIAAEIVQPDLIVAPDFLGDSLTTMKSLDEAVFRFSKEKVLPVVQGDSLGHVLECAEYIIKSGFNRLAVPYDLTSSRSDSVEVMASNRVRVVHSIISRVPIGFEIHLLGMTTLEELESYHTPWVRSIDTGSPVLHGMRCIQFGKGKLLPKDTPTLEKMDSPYVGKDTDVRKATLLPDWSEQLAGIYYNIAYLRKLLR